MGKDFAVWLLLHVCVFVIVVSHFKGMKHEHCELHVQYIAAEKLYFDILVSNYIVSV